MRQGVRCGKIAVVCRDISLYRAAVRYEFRMAEIPLYCDEPTTPEFSAPATAVRALLALPQRPTCIIFPDDFSALGGYNAISEKGLSIPEDVSVMGYDGIYLSRRCAPARWCSAGKSPAEA